MGPFLWAWHPISTAALVQCPPIAGNALSLSLQIEGPDNSSIVEDTALLAKTERTGSLDHEEEEEERLLQQ